jgi:hypothetical protein
VSALSILVAAALCPVSHVHYATSPGAEPGLAKVPWIETSNHAFRGHLFYYGATPWAKERRVGVRIFTTVRRRRISPKVLWQPTRATSARTMTMKLTRIDKPATIADAFPAASSGNQFPSYVSIPAAGCWRVTLTVGRTTGSVVFAAVDDF